VAAGGVAAEYPVCRWVGRREVVPGVATNCMGSSKGEGSAKFGLPQSDGHVLVSHGDLVPGQPEDVFNVLAEDDDQNGRRTVVRSELVVWTTRSTAASCSESGRLGLVLRRCRDLPLAVRRVCRA
jgi:hypothetical protein